MTKEQISRFCKKHKKKIIVGAVVTAGCVVGYMLLRKKPAVPVNIPKIINTFAPKDLPKPEKSVGYWDHFWIDQGSELPMAIINDVHVQFLGELGEEIFDHCEDIGLDQICYDTHVNLIIGFTNE